MNIEQAKRNIIALDAVCGQKDFYDDEFIKALKMAYNSLDMWDTVIEEIKREEDLTDNKYGLRLAEIIIEKYKKEIEELNNNELMVEKITVDLKGLTLMLSCGTRNADMIGQYANAIIKIGNKKLYKVDKIKEYISKTEYVPGVK